MRHSPDGKAWGTDESSMRGLTAIEKLGVILGIKVVRQEHGVSHVWYAPVPDVVSSRKVRVKRGNSQKRLYGMVSVEMRIPPSNTTIARKDCWF